jgi:hypothetical protein
MATRFPPNLFFFLVLLLWTTRGFAQARLWLTDPDHAVFFQEQSGSLPFADATNGHPASLWMRPQHFKKWMVLAVASPAAARRI